MQDILGLRHQHSRAISPIHQHKETKEHHHVPDKFANPNARPGHGSAVNNLRVQPGNKLHRIQPTIPDPGHMRRSTIPFNHTIRSKLQQYHKQQQ